MQSDKVTGESSVSEIVKRLVNVSRRVRSGISDISYFYFFTPINESIMPTVTWKYNNEVYICLFSCAERSTADERTRKPRYKSHIILCYGDIFLK